jgi:hypothetical protein
MTVALEGALIAAVLTPVALSAPLRRTFAALGRRMRIALAAMVVLTLAGQLALHTRSFPFVNWYMYATVPHGDPDVYEYDAVLVSGRRVPLVPGRFLAPESADRLMEALRRQVQRLRADPGAAAARREHEHTLAAVAGLYDHEHPHDRVASVLVTRRSISVRTGLESAPTQLWAVRVR